MNKEINQKISQFLDIEQEPHHFLPKRRSKKKPWNTWTKASVAIVASLVIITVTFSQQSDISDNQSSQMFSNTQITTLSPIQVANEKLPSKLTQHERFKAHLLAHSDDLYLTWFIKL